LEQHFADQQALGKRSLLVVDEAQNLPFAALEELRMLSNITIGGKAPFQGLLLGQPQLRRMLGSSELEQLRQRVLASYHLGPLSDVDTRAYIEHRLKTAGWVGNPSFDDAALHAIYRHTDGIPRRINTLCSRLLLWGALDEASHIGEATVNEVAEELRQDVGSATTLIPAPSTLPAPVTNGHANGHVDTAVTARLDRI